MLDRSGQCRSVLVTGGTDRIGAAIATRFEEAGYLVLVQTRSSEKAALYRAAHPADRPNAIRCPLSTERDYVSLIHLALSASISAGSELTDVIICGSLFQHDTAHEVDDASFKAHLWSNFHGPLIAWRSFYRERVAMSARTIQAGRDSSMGAASFTVLLDAKVSNPNIDHFSYSLSKAAWRGVLDHLAVTGAPYLRTNAVSPGLTMESPGLAGESFIRAHRDTPLGSGPSARNVADACLALAQSNASTGMNWFVDGGARFARRERDPAFAHS